ncbi:ETC complex I subunit [Trinorchestia longiramus]|nr:ETC complex I subunit [Trinorchestia longiramus]
MQASLKLPSAREVWFSRHEAKKQKKVESELAYFCELQLHVIDRRRQIAEARYLSESSEQVFGVTDKFKTSRMASAIKKTTGLTGLAVSRNPHQILNILHAKILRCLQKMPQDAAYRKYTEQIILERDSAVKSEPTVPGLETKLGGGQAEELIQQAERELMLARKMLDWKPWEPLIAEAPNKQWTWPL